MSYLNAKITRRSTPVAQYGVPRARSRWSPLGDTVFDQWQAQYGSDTVFDQWAAQQAQSAQATKDQCDAAGRAAQAPYFAQMSEFAATWKNRDGFYTLDDMSKMFAAGGALINSAQDILDKIKVDFGIQDTAQQDLNQANQNTLNFGVAYGIAKAKGATVIDAPGLYDWMIDVIGAAAEAAYRTAYLQCYLSSATIAYGAVMAALNVAAQAFYAVAKGVAAVAIQAGDVVYKTTVGTLDLAATVVKYAPYIGVAYGLAWLWKNYGKKLKR